MNDNLIFRPDKDKLKEIHNKRKWENDIEYTTEQIQERNEIDLDIYNTMSLLRKRALEERLKQNIEKATRLAEQNTVRNKDGMVVLQINDEWRGD